MVITGNCAIQSGGTVSIASNVRNLRLIARLDVKGPNLIKGVHLEGLRIIGSPAEHALRYYQQGADELIYMDSVASLYGRNHLEEIISSAVNDIFCPITVGGGIRSVDDAAKVLRAGADKVAINTAAIADPDLITRLAHRFGSQSVVLSVEAKQIAEQRWEAYTDNGREPSGLDVLDWIKTGVKLGAGEILLTSVDREGTRKGFDIQLVRVATDAVQIPVIASGGMGKPEDLLPVVNIGNADAIAMADILHYSRATIADVRNIALNAGFNVRQFHRKDS
jgi:cyclase